MLAEFRDFPKPIKPVNLEHRLHDSQDSSPSVMRVRLLFPDPESRLMRDQREFLQGERANRGWRQVLTSAV